MRIVARNVVPLTTRPAAATERCMGLLHAGLGERPLGSDFSASCTALIHRPVPPPIGLQGLSCQFCQFCRTPPCGRLAHGERLHARLVPLRRVALLVVVADRRTVGA
jgi:hypothetical protein